MQSSMSQVYYDRCAHFVPSGNLSSDLKHSLLYSEIDVMFKTWKQAIAKDLRDVTMKLYGQDVASTVNYS